MERCVKVWFAKLGFVEICSGRLRYGSGLRAGMVWHGVGSDWFGALGCGVVCHGMVRHGGLCCRRVRCDLVGSGTVRYGKVRCGAEGCGSGYVSSR